MIHEVNGSTFKAEGFLVWTIRSRRVRQAALITDCDVETGDQERRLAYAMNQLIVGELRSCREDLWIGPVAYPGSRLLASLTFPTTSSSEPVVNGEKSASGTFFRRPLANRPGIP